MREDFSLFDLVLGNPDSKRLKVLLGYLIIFCGMIFLLPYGIYRYFVVEPNSLDIRVVNPSIVNLHQERELKIIFKNTGNYDVQVSEVRLPRCFYDNVVLGDSYPVASDVVFYRNSVGFIYEILVWSPRVMSSASSVVYSFTPVDETVCDDPIKVRVNMVTRSTDFMITTIE